MNLLMEIDMETTVTLFNGVEYNSRHGGPFDRGSADSYYHRPRRPHFFTDATYQSDEIEERFMTKAQIAEYNAGYDYNEQFGDKKDWG
jgi:hypothetical protein